MSAHRSLPFCSARSRALVRYLAGNGGNLQEFGRSGAVALGLVTGLDSDLLAIVALSLQVSLSAVAMAALIGLPLGAAAAVGRFPGRRPLIVLLNAFMGLPPVVVGLVIYLLLSRAGPLGHLGILFTPAAMILAQTVLIVPIIAALSRQVIEDAWVEYGEQLRSLGSGPARSGFTLLWDTRFSLLTVILAGLGRASAEVGAVMIVGGNIDGVTRVMTTTIALETSKGDLPLALALGIVLITLVFALNASAYLIKEAVQRRHG
ncbi:MAG: ABC transporter permease [Burkholderiales bacterium]|nr:ABC transporter permease [Burkholderiales bacterium]